MSLFPSMTGQSHAHLMQGIIAAVSSRVQQPGSQHYIYVPFVVGHSAAISSQYFFYHCKRKLL